MLRGPPVQVDERLDTSDEILIVPTNDRAISAASTGHRRRCHKINYILENNRNEVNLRIGRTMMPGYPWIVC